MQSLFKKKKIFELFKALFVFLTVTHRAGIGKMQAGWCLLLSTQVWAIVYHTNSTSYIYIIFPGGGGGGKKLDRFLGTSCSPVKWMISFQPCRFEMGFWHRLCVLMVAASLNENSQQDTGLQATQIILLTRRSCCLIYLWELWEEGLPHWPLSVSRCLKSTLVSDVLGHVVGYSWQELLLLLKYPCGWAWWANGQEMLSL